MNEKTTPCLSLTLLQETRMKHERRVMNWEKLFARVMVSTYTCIYCSRQEKHLH